jgi:UDP-N-acetyl-2-amino-2-deoxyglucuronate dehydrogenase
VRRIRKVARTAEYYSRPGNGTWQTEGGGALIDQAIHQIDLLRWLARPVTQVNAVLLYSSGATGVIQAATAFEPGYPERIELHGNKGTAIVTGDRLSVWDVKDDQGEPAPISTAVSTGSSDPMGSSVEPFERQFINFAAAILKTIMSLCFAETAFPVSARPPVRFGSLRRPETRRQRRCIAP